MEPHAAAFFDRVVELKELDRTLSCSPSGVTVVVGPKSCGKTVLLRELCRTRDAVVPRPLYVSARASDCSGPDALSQALLRGVQHAWRLDGAALSRLLPGVTHTLPLLNIPIHVPFHFPFKPPTTMQSVIDTYLRLVTESAEARARGAAQPFPVIIVDEAHRLAEWEDKRALQQLLDFFVHLSKEACLAHVVLATSDAFLTTWLDAQGVTPEFRTLLPVGNLSAEEAAQFCARCLTVQFPRAPPCDGARWARVLEVCGGNPGALRSCAAAAAVRGDWDAACDSMLYSARRAVHAGLQQRSGGDDGDDNDRGWTPQQYAAVLAALAAAPHGALRCRELEAAGAGAGGAGALEAMQRRNALLRRSWHPSLRDLPAAAFGHPPEDVYALPSAAHLAVARAMHAAEDGT